MFSYDGRMKEKTYIGNRIRNKRISLDMTAEEVALKSHVSRATLSAMENGRGNVSLDALLRVLKTLDISLSFDEAYRSTSKRERVKRRFGQKQKRINRFIVMCVEQYAKFSNLDSASAYRALEKAGILDELEKDYEDLHGMSTQYLNEYFSASIVGGKA